MSSATMPRVLVLLLLCCSCFQSFARPHRPVVKPPKRTFKTVLSVDGGGLRDIIPTVVLVEVEHSIKRYLLAHPELLPKDAVISKAEDFDVELADYFDVATGISAGSWMALYLASRGGQGFARGVLDDPSIIKKYGSISAGSAEALRVFFLEYGAVIYPPSAINFTAGPPFDLFNPLSTGVSQPVYENHEGLETSLEAFLGNTTMADLDTSVIVPSFDGISGYPLLFVTNNFGDGPVTSTAKMIPRFEPRRPGQTPFQPDLQFDEGANYYLRDVGTAAGTVAVLYPAKPVSRVNNETTEFLCFDGVYPVDSSAIIANFFAASENGFNGFEDIALISLGSGTPLMDWTRFSNAGLAQWLDGLALTNFILGSGQFANEALLDYAYYSNPKTKPYQYLRIDTAASAATEEGMAFSAGNNPSLTSFFEGLGLELADKFRQSIDIFVRDFLFSA